MSNIISRMFVSLGLKNKDFKKGLKQSEKETKGFGKTVSKIATQIGIAFGVREILRFGKELVNLAGEAEGVQRAFEHIGGQEIFADLKGATKGTVSDLELMKKSVQASNFQIPLENLASLFEFAAARAAQTGESVDFLVNSIVLGIGRKSPLILDNLGISAVRLRETLKGAGVEMTTVGDIANAVGKIATEEMAKMGDTSVTAGQQIQSFAATWENLKLNIGRGITQTKEFEASFGFLGFINDQFNKTSKATNDAREQAKKLFEVWKTSGQLTPEFISKQTAELEDQKRQLLDNGGIIEKGGKARHQQIRTLLVLLAKETKANSSATVVLKDQEDTISSIAEEIKLLKTIQADATGSRLVDINKEIVALSNELSALKKIGTEIDKNATKSGVLIKKSIDTKEVDQRIKQAPIELPTVISGDGSLGNSAQLESLMISNQVAADQEIVRNELMKTQNAMTAYGSVMGSVGQIAGAMGDSTIATFANVASQVISSVAQMIPALFSSSVAGAVNAGAALPFPANLAAIAAGVAGVVSAFSGIGGGSASAPAVTSIDTRGVQSPTTNNTDSRRSVNSQTQNINVEIVGTIKGKDIALANNQGQKQLKQ